MSLAQKLKDVRTQKGWSMQALSRKSGVDVGIISRIEGGTRPHVTVVVLKRLARALGVSLDELGEMHEKE